MAFSCNTCKETQVRENSSLIARIIYCFHATRAQNNGRSPDNDRPKMPLDWSLFYLTGRFNRPHLYAFRWNFKSTSEEEEGGEQSDDEEAMQEGSD